MRVHILVIEDDSVLNQLLVAQIEAFGYAAQGVRTWAAAQSWMEANEPDLLVLDCRLPDADGLELLSRLGHIQPVVMLTAFASVQNAVQAIKGGAAEYLVKPINLDELEVVLKRALETAQLRKENQFLKRRVGQTSHVMVGSSKPLSEVNRLIDAVAPSDMTVLIQGESGVGKELVAHAIHARSKRIDQPFVPVDCCVLQKQLFESELFGHEKGAFTSAEQQKKGLIEGARGGTLFLDEIGDMPPEAQTRLLRVLQEGEYTTVGGRTPIRANVRIVAATHRDLTQLIRQGMFREDLFYRLNVVPIRLPPLRERVEDIAELIRHFLSLAASEGLPPKTIDGTAMDRLRRHRWPGNVRELENLVRRLAALYSQEVIGIDVIEAELAGGVPMMEPQAAPDGEGLSASVERHLRDYFSAHADGMPAAGLYDRVLREIERPLITLTLEATRGNQIKAAHVLGLNRNTLRKKIRDLDVQVVRGLK
ncbi:MAG: sigma 54-interacting transcriptional regulator [Alphaproteobacteria bacterium]|nr:sigma 54-interacting transcriptional regulator [Alphaproteobacteria bacterium]